MKKQMSTINLCDTKSDPDDFPAPYSANVGNNCTQIAYLHRELLSSDT